MFEWSTTQISELNNDEILDMLWIELHTIIQKRILLTSVTIAQSDVNDLNRYKIDNELTEFVGIINRERKKITIILLLLCY